MDFLSPPRLVKSLNITTWDYHRSLVKKIPFLEEGTTILVQYNLCIGFHTKEELLSNKKEFVYDLYFLKYKNGLYQEHHCKKCGNIKDLKNDFDISLI
jgi:hypothetical protein